MHEFSCHAIHDPRLVVVAQAFVGGRTHTLKRCCRKENPQYFFCDSSVSWLEFRGLGILSGLESFRSRRSSLMNSSSRALCPRNGPTACPRFRSVSLPWPQPTPPTSPRRPLCCLRRGFYRVHLLARCLKREPAHPSSPLEFPRDARGLCRPAYLHSLVPQSRQVVKRFRSDSQISEFIVCVFLCFM